MMSFINRVLMAAVLAAGLWSPAAQAQDKTLRIGFQKYGTLVILKERGALEKRLKSQGYTVTWTEFPGGPQLLEALNVGAIDFGSTGEAPPIFAQAAGAPLLYVGHEPPAPKGEALIVPKDSKITTVADLKGKRVALNKGSNVHYLLVRALEANGLSLSDIESVFLPPADARAAFESGKVDAWVIWDPFLARHRWRQVPAPWLMGPGWWTITSSTWHRAALRLIGATRSRRSWRN
jgi:sulfonate transport system substrate-binding protein